MKGSARGPHIRGHLRRLKSHFLEAQGRGMRLCQVPQKSLSCVYSCKSRKKCCSILFYSILPQHSQSNRGQPKQDLDADEKS